MGQHLVKVLIVDSFLKDDPLINKAYTAEQIDYLRSLIIATITNYTVDQTIVLIGYCGGEFTNIYPFRISIDNLKTYISQLNTEYFK